MTEMFTDFGAKVTATSRWSGDTHYDDKSTLRGLPGSETNLGSPWIPSQTSGSIAVNGSITGRLDRPGEVDIYRIPVSKFDLFTVNLNGSGAQPVGDTFLRLLDQNGNPIGYDDDGGIGVNSLLTFRSKVDGFYYVEARSFTAPGQPPGIGEYSLSFSKMGRDEAPGGFAGAKVLAVDSSIVGFTNFSGDNDVYRITLKAGEYYEFQIAGGADYEARLKDANGKLKLGEFEIDTRLAIYDSQGNLLRVNDDLSFPDDLSSGIGFVPEVDGQYYVAVLPYSGAIGGYNLEAKHVDLSKLDPRDSIDWGTKVELKPGNVVNVYFAKAGETFDGITSLGWNAYEIKQAMVAFDQYESIINVDFRIVTDVNQATFKLVTTQGGGPLGYFNPPGETNQGVGVFWRDGFGWDENGEGGLEQGGYGFITLIHEFGHGMGLAHPHDNGGTSLVMPGAFGPFNFLGAFDLNQGVYSTMSYNDGWQMHPDIASNGYPPGVPVSYGYQGTMMALDIAVLQSKYGANTTFANGDNVYVLPTTNGTGSYYSTIWDTGGVDSIVHNGSQSATIDLRSATLDYSFTGAGALSWVDGVFGGFTIAAGAKIENARGGSGADIIVANEWVNELTGGAGADVFRFHQVNAGDRITDFGNGADTLDLSAIDARRSTAADEAFILVAAFGKKEGELLLAYDSAANATRVQGDVNGDGIADFELLLNGQVTSTEGWVL